MAKRIHLIAIGGSVMHNLALALHKQGNKVSGSDDEIFEPSHSRLEKAGLLPDQMGWDANRITQDIDAVILGMHAKEDNPELLRAQELGLAIYSFPDFIAVQCEDKQRIVIAGSHGKTTITAMVLHVLQYHNREFDFLIGAQLDGFDVMVKLSDAPVIVIEGDEYLTSVLDKTPKFLKYNHHIGLVSGIAWDHINAFPTDDVYVEQFDKFADASPKAGTLIYCEEDDMTTVICGREREDVARIPYKAHDYTVKNGETFLKTRDHGEVKVNVFGYHNMQNISGAMALCKRIGILEGMFYEAISSFKGASKRLELLQANDNMAIYRDFAHAPSKVNASIKALREQYPDRKLVVALELHTYSSLSKDFLPKYKDTLAQADVKYIFINQDTLAQKGYDPISEQELQEAFQDNSLQLFSDINTLQAKLSQINENKMIVALMTSGSFGGLDIFHFANDLVHQVQ